MNIELKNEFIRIAKDVFGYLKSIDYKIYCNTEPKITFDQYWRHYEDVEVPDYAITLLLNCDKYINAIDLKKLNELFMSEFPFIKNVIKTNRSSQSFYIRRILEIVLITTFELNPSLDNYEEVIIKELEKLSEIFISRKTKVMEIYPLINVDIYDDFEKYCLEEDIYLRRLTDKEVNYFDYNETRSFSTKSYSRFALVVEYYEEIVFSADVEPKAINIKERIKSVQNNLIYSLNLLYSGCVAFNEVCRLSSDYYSNFGGRSISAGYINLSPNRVLLNLKSFENWMDKYRLLQSINLSPYNLALNRLSEAERRFNKLDIIIDCVIALESILLNDIGNEKTRGELKFRFSINYASLFPKYDRKKQKKIANDIYDLRSTIVHGGSKILDKIIIGDEELSITSASDKIKNILRFLLNHLLMLPNGLSIDNNGFWINKLLNLD